MKFLEYLTEKKSLIEKYLDKYLPSVEQKPQTIHKAMRYSIFAGGKRLRPALCLLTTEILGGEIKKALPWASSIEMLHTYTLIHDDLPALDNDDYRRGKLTCHKKFGESTAILTGLALLCRAYEIVTDIEDASYNRGRALGILLEASGHKGVLKGQILDLTFENKNIKGNQLYELHFFKTAKLITASILIGAVIANCSEQDFKALKNYGHHLGVAFQIRDDILNVIGDEKKLGKRVGSDAEHNKATYPKLYGLKVSLKLLKEEIDKAKESLEDFSSDKELYYDIANFVGERGF